MCEPGGEEADPAALGEAADEDEFADGEGEEGDGEGPEVIGGTSSPSSSDSACSSRFLSLSGSKSPTGTDVYTV